jgi:hypothetical protein
MKTRISLKSKTISALLLAGIGMNIVSAFFFIRLDRVVHVDLYNYGLRYSEEWSAPYWTYSRWTLSCLAVTMLMTGIATVFILIHARTRGSGSKSISYLLLALGITSTGFSAFFLNSLNILVHSELYRYGLMFSEEWATQYWRYANTIFSLLGLATATTVTSISLIYLSARPLIKIDTTKLVCAILVSAGAITLTFSISYTSSILAFIGLGLLFWGIITKYITTEEYVKKTILDTTTLFHLVQLDDILKELNYNNRAVYLPPKYLINISSNNVYIAKHKDTKLPKAEEIMKERITKENKIFMKNPEGILLLPPGNELTKLFEKTLKTSFTRVSLAYLEQNIPKLLIEDLEIAEDVKIEMKNSTIHVTIHNSIYKDTCKETSKLSNVSRSLGCPITSAIACALAKATGKPVTITKDQTSKDGKIIDVTYELLQEPEEKSQ